MMRINKLLAAALITAGAAFATAGTAGSAALPVPQTAKVETAGPAAPLVQINHRRKYYKKRRYSNHSYRRHHYRRNYARRSCYYNYYGDLVCGRRYGYYRPQIYFGFGF